jgi:serine/threonine-protein kinase RsbT
MNKKKIEKTADTKHKIALDFIIKGNNFSSAGEASIRLKRALQHIGYPALLIRRVAVAAYEAEMNIIIHAHRGVMKAEITPEMVTIWAEDEGPGIPNVDLAMQEGYSTAPDYIREMGFGAGMGLPNIKRCADKFDIKTYVEKRGNSEKGTKIKIIIYNN